MNLTSSVYFQTMKLKEDVDTGNLAKVLVSLGGFSDHSGDGSTKNPESDEKDLSPLSLTSSSSSSSAALGLSADEMERRFLEMNEYAHLLHKRELSAKTPDEIELMRRERNR